jgi:1-acyl-sn-glycerol-3-phosphate acyltransferase
VPALPPGVPRRGGRLWRAGGRALLALLRWRIEGAVPPVSRCVLIVAPHTSNWDFVVGLAAKLALGLRVHWLGKHTLFRGPFDGVLRWLGGIPVDRDAALRVVDAAVARFEAAPQLFLAMAPEGTRRRVLRWKSGFHRIAVGAGVPILPVALDWGARAVRLQPLFQPTPDFDADLERLRAGFGKGMARHADGF